MTKQLTLVTILGLSLVFAACGDKKDKTRVSRRGTHTFDGANGKPSPAGTQGVGRVEGNLDESTGLRDEDESGSERSSVAELSEGETICLQAMKWISEGKISKITMTTKEDVADDTEEDDDKKSKLATSSKDLKLDYVSSDSKIVVNEKALVLSIRKSDSTEDDFRFKLVKADKDSCTLLDNGLNETVKNKNVEIDLELTINDPSNEKRKDTSFKIDGTYTAGELEPKSVELNILK